MLGVRDLVSHLLHMVEREGIPENKLIKSSFTKLVFIALACCYRYGVQIRYDILFRKSPYGASSGDVDRLLGDRYSRQVNFKNAREIKELTKNEEFDRIITAMIEEEVESPLSFVQYIVNSEAFKSANYKERDRKVSIFMDYLLLPMEADQVWNLKEILLYAGFNEDEIDSNPNFDLRLPLEGDEYDVIAKYLTLHAETMKDDYFKSKVTHEFTLDEIEKIRMIPESILDSVRLHGARRVKK